MKKISLSLFLFTLLFYSCKYTQVIYTAPSSADIKSDSSYYKYENDTLRVVYSFWRANGLMSFMIYNKLDIPIYIDWKKSSYIDKSMKLDYYSEKESKTWVAETESYVYNNPINWLNIFGPTIISGSVGSSTSVKEERITFIPPKSYIFRGFYKIFPNQHFVVTKENKKEIPVSEGSTKTFPAYVLTAEKSNSSLIFRNFLTYSTKENFEKESYVNDEFYVRKVLTMRQKYFYNLYGPLSPSEPTQWGSNYEDPRRFYIPNLNSEEIFSK